MEGLPRERFAPSLRSPHPELGLNWTCIHDNSSSRCAYPLAYGLSVACRNEDNRVAGPSTLLQILVLDERLLVGKTLTDADQVHGLLHRSNTL